MEIPRRTSREMFPLVELYLAGEATQKQFCAEHALSLPVLNYWVAKYRRTTQAESEAGFVELLSDPASAERPFMEVAYPRGLRGKIRPDVYTTAD